MIAKTPKKSREFLEAECVRIANGQIEGRGTERVTIKRLFVKGTGPNWEVDNSAVVIERRRQGSASRDYVQTGHPNAGKWSD
jgi:hypothetical protein